MEVGGTPLPDGQGHGVGLEGHGVDAQEREKIAGPPARDVARRSEKMGGTCVGPSGGRPPNVEKPC